MARRAPVAMRRLGRDCGWQAMRHGGGGGRLRQGGALARSLRRSARNGTTVQVPAQRIQADLLGLHLICTGSSQQQHMTLSATC